VISPGQHGTFKGMLIDREKYWLDGEYVDLLKWVCKFGPESLEEQRFWELDKYLRTLRGSYRTNGWSTAAINAEFEKWHMKYMDVPNEFEPYSSQADVMRELSMPSTYHQVGVDAAGMPEIEPDPLPCGELRVRAWGEPDNVHHTLGLITIEVANPPTHQAERILLGVLPKVLELFLNKNKDYGDDFDEFKLGAKGQFVDIWRKVGKLKLALWDGKELAGEQVPEIMMDLIGHLLLALLDPHTGRKG